MPASKVDAPPSNLTGVGPILEKIKQDAADKGEATMDVEDTEGKDEQGKQFTLTVQTQRELRREAKKKAYEESKARQVAECAFIPCGGAWLRGPSGVLTVPPCHSPLSCAQSTQARTQKHMAIHSPLSFSLVSTTR